VLFQPESQRIVVGQQTNSQGKIVQKYIIAKTLVKDVIFEETYDTSLQPESSNSNNGGTTGGGTNPGDNTGGGTNTGGGDNNGGDGDDTGEND
jgi:hypothetical protein